MNLALKDIRFNLTRFVLTATGVGFLIMASVGMVGLYRGIVDDALLIIETVGADLWVVQGGRSGPFAEGSAIASSTDRRVEGLAGVAEVRRFVQSSQQFPFEGRDRRATLTGLDYPKDRGRWVNLVHGRLLNTGHHEAIADASIGLAIGDKVRLGLDDYTVVGVTHGMVDSLGDGLLFVSVNDAIAIAQRRSSEEVLLARAAGAVSGDRAGTSSVAQDSKIAAVLVRLDPAADPDRIASAIQQWGDVNVIGRDEQRNLLLDKRLWRLRVQILAFTGVLLAVMTIVISLIIYTMTVEKLHQIAMLKLIGARNATIASMVVQQAALIGFGGFTMGVTTAALVFPYFPRRVVIATGDIVVMLAAVAAICGIGSMVGVSRAMRVRAQEVLS
ncbi:ABC transporter permease [Reyranella sp.]|uniref:ABC transporter permease n=1 Tax=Reyranella sp. TaxID=1929291 RepID=UPI003BA928B5